MVPRFKVWNEIRSWHGAQSKEINSIFIKVQKTLEQSLKNTSILDFWTNGGLDLPLKKGELGYMI